MAETSVREVPPPWRKVFLIELPLVAGTLVYWLVAPAEYLRSTVGLAPTPAAIDLLHQYAATVGSLVLFFYGRVLLARPIELRTFRYLQQGLLLGDIALVGLGLASLGSTTEADTSMLAAQIAMAGLWGAIRVVFLLRVRA